MKQVEVRNNWENLEYFLDGEPLNKTQNFKARIEFPDGTQCDTEVQARALSKSYSDHGQTYTTNTTELYINTSVHGIAIKIPLEQLKLQL